MDSQKETPYHRLILICYLVLSELFTLNNSPENEQKVFLSIKELYEKNLIIILVKCNTLMQTT